MSHTNFLGASNNNFQIAKEDLEKIEIAYFSYGLISQGKVVLSYFTHEEWGHIYQEKHYNKLDPLLRGVVYSHFPLIVWDALHPFGQEKKIMVERNEICNLKSGLTLGIKNRGCTEIIALGSEIPPREFHFLLKDENYTRKIYEMISNFYQTHQKSFS